MFTDKSIPENLLKELLPCKIGDKVYAIRKNLKSYNPKTYSYELEIIECEGFIIEAYNGCLKVIPARDSWDGWYGLYDHKGFGYYTDKEEALKKIKELNEFEEFKVQNKWLENW